MPVITLYLGSSFQSLGGPQGWKILHSETSRGAEQKEITIIATKAIETCGA